MKLYLCNDFARPMPRYSQQHEMTYRLLDRLLGQEERLKGREIVIGKDEAGKPFLKDCPDLWFNISHCPVCVAVVLSDRPVGVDVQERFAWKEKLAQKISSDKEKRWLWETEDIRERADRLNRLWSRKESYLKCIGQGLKVPPSTISVPGKADVLENSEGLFSFTEFQNASYTLCICEASAAASPGRSPAAAMRMNR